MFADSSVNTTTGAVAIGYNPFYKKSAGNYGIAIGYNAGYTVSTAANSIIIGYNAVNGGVHTGTNTIAIGQEAGKILTSGAYNILMGYKVGAEQGVRRGYQCLARALVVGERRLAGSLAARREVGVQVGVAKAVDRLLRIADQKERQLVLGGVDPPQDRELQRVGVLELVDQRGRKRSRSAGQRGRFGCRSRAGRAGWRACRRRRRRGARAWRCAPPRCLRRAGLAAARAGHGRAGIVSARADPATAARPRRTDARAWCAPCSLLPRASRCRRGSPSSISPASVAKASSVASRSSHSCAAAAIASGL